MTILFENGEELYIEESDIDQAQDWADTFNTEIKEIL